MEQQPIPGEEILLLKQKVWYRGMPTMRAKNKRNRGAMYLLTVSLMGWVALTLFGLVSQVQADETVTVIAHSDEYFPDRPGNRWQYRGEISEGPLQVIDQKFFVNESKVTGTRTVKGVTVTVFHDTNAGNHGPSDSFYRRDAAGIVYYGSEPGTPLEQQLVPYQIVRFPLTLSSSFQQFDRNDLDFGTDVDGDGTNEHVDVQGVVSVLAQESVNVPAGSYPDAVKVEARMTLRIHLSSTGKSATGIDVMTAWFAKGVGLIKYVERQELPPIRTDRGMVTEISEELDEYQVQSASGSFSRRESSTESVLADHAGDHELGEIVFPTGLRTDS